MIEQPTKVVLRLGYVIRVRVTGRVRVTIRVRVMARRSPIRFFPLPFPGLGCRTLPFVGGS